MPELPTFPKSSLTENLSSFRPQSLTLAQLSKTTLAFALFLVTFEPTCARKPQKAEPSGLNLAPAVRELNIKGRKVWVIVAETPAERTKGLMFRSYLAPDSGMLFVFEKDEHLHFWMKNTYIPLAIAYIDSIGVITDILQMKPLDTLTPYRSSKPVRYALEVNSDWFYLNHIKVGDTVSGLPTQKAP